MRRALVVYVLAMFVGSLACAAAEGLVGHWTFDEGKGDVLRDRSGNGNHGKIHGAKWIKNGEGHALEFDGVDDFVDCGTGASLDLQEKVSMAVWVWLDKPPVPRDLPIIGKPFSGYLMTHYGGGIWAYIAGGPHNIKSVVPRDSWHLVVSTFDGRVFRLYVDGQLANESVLDVKPKAGGHFCMGRIGAESEWTRGSHFHGRIAEARVYNRALTHAEISRQFRATNLTDAVTVSAIAVPWQDRIVAEVNVRGLGEQNAGVAVGLELHPRTPHQPPPRARATSFDAMGLASVTLPVPKLPPGDYVVRAVARDAAGKQVGLPGTADIKWTLPQRFPKGPKGARQLNNLVTELLNIPGPDASGRNYSFTNPKTGWIFISNAGSSEVALSAADPVRPQKIALKDVYHEAHEAMRYVPKGKYRITTRLARNLIVRSVPHLVFDSYHSVPKVKEFGPYIGAFQKKYIFPHINTFVGSRRANETDLKMWKAYGKNWLIHCNVLLDKGDKLVTVEDAYQYLVSRKNANNPYVDGLIADEYGDSRRYCDPWADAINRFFSEPKYQDKIYVPFAGALWNGEPGRKLARAVFKHDGLIALKTYLKEQRTEAAAWRYIEQTLVKNVRGFHDNLPGSPPHVLICFGWHLCAPNESLDSLPHVSFKNYIETQLNIAANHPAFEDLGGVMTYTAGYSDEETVRWSMRLFRHYAIEGHTDTLSKDPYMLTHIADPDFEMKGKGWALRPAEEGSIRFDTHAGFAYLAQRYPRSNDGTNVLVTVRSAARPNVFSTEIKNLEPGRIYNLRTFSGDFKDLTAEVKHAVSVKINGATLIRDKCFDAVVPNCHRFGPYKKRGDAWVNYYWRVFRAKGKTAKLTISDWATDRQPGGPIGQELMYNFIQVQPYFEE